MRIRTILNGQKAGNPLLHEAIATIRQHHFFALDVRIAYLPEDLPALIRECADDGIDRIVAGGGDGTLNGVLNAMMALEEAKRPELAILPLGTANDFATAAEIPLDPYDALLMAINGESRPVDVGCVNARYFLNVASGGFGAQVTTETPPELKSILGGGAYALTGILKLFSFTPVRGTLRIGEYRFEGSSFATAVCNGRQAGGGMLLSPEACIDDGLLDIALFTLEPLSIPSELSPPSATLFGGMPFRKILRASEVEFTPEEPQMRRINLDGEPYEADSFRFRILPGALRLVLPDTCPMLKENTP
ncbi:lipid kinase YegS [Nitratifractor sp.]|uniref:lipid kinase YegS n=1 Tax=Nitratifractor sp. TaxID=2268144 RepID=UPI0025CE70C0|nr:lipid kinase YegS [Nitratifractor sp.]